VHTSPFLSAVTVTAYADNGRHHGAQVFFVPANPRFNVNMRDYFPSLVAMKFVVISDSTGANPAQITAEASVYLSADGVTWSAGSNAQATPLK
jgi:hypothetical protein